VEFEFTPDQLTFQWSVRELLAAIVDDDLHERVHRTGAAHDRSMALALAARGWLKDAMPGTSGDPVRLHILFSEMEKAGAPYEALAVNILVAAVLDIAGSAMHRSHVVQQLLAGAENICLGYSEPDAGSDLTGVTTTAVRDAAEWTISGQKIWTTMAQDAAWMFALTRTSPSAPPRRGATMFLVPMDSPGITVHPILTMGGDRVNAVFLDDVRVGDEWRVGEVDGAWQVMGLALSLERGVIGNSQLGVPLLRAAVRWFAEAEESGEVALEDPAVREAIATMAIDNQVGSLLGLRAAVDAAEAGQDGRVGVAGSMVKVFVSERYVRNANLLQELAGQAGLLARGVPGAAGAGWLDQHVRHAPVTRIAGGTTEINRNNIAERYLDLPRSR
jgi:alkylation response protein AidB-like acyl-CoA dehydrogenase